MHVPKLGCAEPERNKVNTGMAVAVPVFQDALRDGFFEEILQILILCKNTLYILVNTFLYEKQLAKQRYGEAKPLWSVGLCWKKYITLLHASHWYSPDILWAFKQNDFKIPSVTAFQDWSHLSIHTVTLKQASVNVLALV